jgi:hypothetical protein
MTVETDLVFISNNKTIYDPLKITADVLLPGTTLFKIQNFGQEKLKNLGIYLRPSSNVGPWNNPADQPPATDYQDVLTWGTESDLVSTTGGIKIYSPATSLTGYYITRSKGSQWTNRVMIDDLDAGDTLDIKLEFEVPSSISARRLFINLVVG